MDVLFLGAKMPGEVVCNYYLDTLSMVGFRRRVFCYGPGYEDYSPTHRIEDVLAAAPFAPDLIVVGQSWEHDAHPTEFDRHPGIRLDALDRPVVMFLNKEYKKLPEKLRFVRENRVDLVLSTAPTIVDTVEIDGARFVHFPFAVNTEMFRPDYPSQDIDAGFAGSLHLSYTALRFRMRRELADTAYRSLRIHWGDWQDAGTFTGADYPAFLRRCRVGLSTPSALDAVGTRFLEIMASGSLLLCPASTEYRGMFEPGVHCVTFAADLADFRDKLFWILGDEDARRRITCQAVQHVQSHHGIATRTRELDRILVELL